MTKKEDFLEQHREKERKAKKYLIVAIVVAVVLWIPIALLWVY